MHHRVQGLSAAQMNMRRFKRGLNDELEIRCRMRRRRSPLEHRWQQGNAFGQRRCGRWEGWGVTTNDAICCRHCKWCVKSCFLRRATVAKSSNGPDWYFIIGIGPGITGIRNGVHDVGVRLPVASSAYVNLLADYWLMSCTRMEFIYQSKQF